MIADYNTDHVFYAGPDVPLLMRKLNDHNEYKVVAPLHSVFVVHPAPMSSNGRKDDELDLDISYLLRTHSLTSLQLSPPRFTAGGDLEDPYIDVLDPLAKQRRETRTAKRLHRQLFPGAPTTEAILPVLQMLLDGKKHHNREQGNVKNNYPLFHEGFNNLNKDFLLSPLSTDPLQPPAEFVQFAFHAGHLRYLAENYCGALFTAQEDPDGSRLKEEESLYGHSLPRWEWQRRQGEWLLLQDDAGNSILAHCPLATVGVLDVHPVVVRARMAHIEFCLFWYTWETQILKRLGRTPGRTSLHRLYELTDKGMSLQRKVKDAVRSVLPSRALQPYYWPPEVFPELGVDGVPQHVAIL